MIISIRLPENTLSSDTSLSFQVCYVKVGEINCYLLKKSRRKQELESCILSTSPNFKKQIRCAAASLSMENSQETDAQMRKTYLCQ